MNLHKGDDLKSLELVEPLLKEAAKKNTGREIGNLTVIIMSG